MNFQNSLYSCDPKVLLQRPGKWKIPKSGWERVQKVLWAKGAKGHLRWRKRELHRCKIGFRWCKRLLGDLCSLGSKNLLHPLLTTLAILRFRAAVAGTWGPNYTVHPLRKSPSNLQGKGGGKGRGKSKGKGKGKGKSSASADLSGQ